MIWTVAQNVVSIFCSRVYVIIGWGSRYARETATVTTYLELTTDSGMLPSLVLPNPREGQAHDNRRR